PTQTSTLSLHDALPIYGEDRPPHGALAGDERALRLALASPHRRPRGAGGDGGGRPGADRALRRGAARHPPGPDGALGHPARAARSEEHTSELQSLRHLV